jgi:hypothetical protein
METTSLIIEDRLYGAYNFLSWKARLTLLLKEYELWDLVDKLVVPPTNMTSLEDHNKKDIKEERVLLDSVKNHLIPHLFENKMTKEIFYSLVILF